MPIYDLWINLVSVTDGASSNSDSMDSEAEAAPLVVLKFADGIIREDPTNLLPGMSIQQLNLILRDLVTKQVRSTLVNYNYGISGHMENLSDSIRLLLDSFEVILEAQGETTSAPSTYSELAVTLLGLVLSFFH